MQGRGCEGNTSRAGQGDGIDHSRTIWIRGLKREKDEGQTIKISVESRKEALGFMKWTPDKK